MVGAGVVMGPDALRDGIETAPSHEGVHEAVTATVAKVFFGEALTAQAAVVVAHRYERAQECTRGAPCGADVAIENDRLVGRNEWPGP